MLTTSNARIGQICHNQQIMAFSKQFPDLLTTLKLKFSSHRRATPATYAVLAPN